jgi:hypothetical protein
MTYTAIYYYFSGPTTVGVSDTEADIKEEVE